jgi:hypothetical protein
MTQMGSQMVEDIWEAIRAEGALSTAVFSRRIAGTITSTSLISGGVADTTFSTGQTVLLSAFREGVIDGVNVALGDRKARLRIASLTVTPDTDDQVAIGSITYRIMAVRQDTDGATYTLHLRQA